MTKQPDELVGRAEIAKRLGLSQPSIVHTWTVRYPDFPQPVEHVHAGVAIYRWLDVVAWCRKNRPELVSTEPAGRRRSA